MSEFQIASALVVFFTVAYGLFLFWNSQAFALWWMRRVIGRPKGIGQFRIVLREFYDTRNREPLGGQVLLDVTDDEGQAVLLADKHFRWLGYHARNLMIHVRTADNNRLVKFFSADTFPDGQKRCHCG